MINSSDLEIFLKNITKKTYQDNKENVPTFTKYND